MKEKYEIRQMGARGIAHRYFCGGTTCTVTCVNLATLYLVRKKSNPMDRAESRSRRCQQCADIDAKALGIPALKVTK
jgi:hypothetical protein